MLPPGLSRTPLPKRSFETPAHRVSGLRPAFLSTRGRSAGPLTEIVAATAATHSCAHTLHCGARFLWTHREPPPQPGPRRSLRALLLCDLWAAACSPLSRSDVTFACTAPVLLTSHCPRLLTGAAPLSRDPDLEPPRLLLSLSCSVALPHCPGYCPLRPQFPQSSLSDGNAYPAGVQWP